MWSRLVWGLSLAVWYNWGYLSPTPKTINVFTSRKFWKQSIAQARVESAKFSTSLRKIAASHPLSQAVSWSSPRPRAPTPFTGVPAVTKGMMRTRWTMGDIVPEIIGIHFKARNNCPGRDRGLSQLTYISPAPHPCPAGYSPHLTLARWPDRSRVSAGLPVLFCHDCCEQGRSE